MSAISSIVFYAFSALAIGAALIVVTSRNVFHSAMALTGALAVVAGFFALLSADFLAASQVLIYVGGIMIIMLFVVMFSQQPLDALMSQTNNQWLWGILFGSAVAAALVRSFRDAYAAYGGTSGMAPTSTALGRLLLTDMIVPFEAVSLVLLAALVGAVIFAQDRKSSK